MCSSDLVAVNVGVAVIVGVSVKVTVGVGVAVTVAVIVGVSVAVAVNVGVIVGLAVAVAVGVGVNVAQVFVVKHTSFDASQVGYCVILARMLSNAVCSSCVPFVYTFLPSKNQPSDAICVLTHSFAISLSAWVQLQSKSL